MNDQLNLEKKYDQALEFLYGLERFGILLGLDNIQNILNRIDNPQGKFDSIHVAGSNGKGSTASFITNMLTLAGYKTALYTSPHLNDFRERIRIGGELVSKESLVEAFERIKEFYDPERTTFFEFTTAMAFDCIARAKPDVAIIEVGLGGRLDATNTINPLVSIITDISLEHEDYLGKGLAAVAGEKAGIIKKNTPVITGATRKIPFSVISAKAKELQAPLKLFGKDFKGKRTGLSSFHYFSPSLSISNMNLGMPGAHQMKNASLAIATIEELKNRGFDISDEVIREAVLKTRFPGRFELLRQNPDVIIDGAHTPEGMRLLKSSIKRNYPNRKPLLLFGALKDKNYGNLAGIIAPVAKMVMCVAPHSDRSVDSGQMSELFTELGVSSCFAPSIEDGFAKLMEMAHEDDLIVAAGSLYMIGPIRKLCGHKDE
jgi:dihydrofolate synthase/folylpolyglutamate synthase